MTIRRLWGLFVALGSLTCLYVRADEKELKPAEKASVSLTLTEDVFDPAKPSKAVLKGVVKNGTAEAISIAPDYDGTSIKLVSGTMTLHKSLVERKKPFSPAKEVKTVSVEPGAERVILELNLEDTFLKTNEWRWDWMRRPEPPRSPIHKWRKPGFNDQASLQIEVRIKGREVIRSNAVVVKIKPTAARQIPVIVTGEVKPTDVAEGAPIPLVVTIRNELADVIEFHGYGIKATDWNAETANLTLVDIYRDGEPGGLFMSAPMVSPPLAVAGMSRESIPAGMELKLETDVRKWTIKGGWVPGRYRLNVRVNNLRADEHSTLNTLSDSFAFVIKK